ncbi:MAG: hypothetical protein ACE5HT_12425 [Gemmatimonadales bacterium]
MLTRDDLREQIEHHLEGHMTLEDLSAWAEQAFRDEAFEPRFAEQIASVLSTLRDATDPHRFRWEEPDLGSLIELLQQ